ncbi:NAD(P)H-dependent flavin oxidoreductase [Halosimplex aquaticum]|uniref:NAD(P)H-dependent flavin oxidoreductase n=1 Tax=Halosimplex aquaticum TaxID=3026162 RepID=A0ABD5YAJ4_9EURY|nr:nitronate monooxygenase [Halosimplex aquaticum]
MSLHTPLCDRLGIDHPVVQAPVGSVSTPELAATVSNAGGLGTLAVTWRDFEETRAAIEAVRDRTGAPFAVNLVLDDGATEHPTDDHLDACLDAGVPLVSFSFGDPAPYVGRVHDAGADVLATVGSADDARTAVEAGVDAVVAQGWEAGGHVQSDVATMALVPRVADETPDHVPVVAAGGIADGRGLAAALALGADGVWVGTRFVATEEADAHERYRSAVVDGAADETVRGTPFPKGWPDQPHRTLESRATERWIAAGRPPLDERDDADRVVAETASGEPLERYVDLPPLSGVDGCVEELPHYAGQSVGGVDEVVPAAAVVERLVEDATATVESLERLRDDDA